MKRWFLLLFLLHCGAAAAWTLDAGDRTLHLSDYKVKWVLVNFWATWCPPCLEEIPALERLHSSGKIEVVGIAVSYEKKKEVLDFAKSHGITYPLVLGNEDTAAKFGGLDSLPTSFLYSPDGKLVGAHQGPLTEAEVLSAESGDRSLFSAP